jgi:N-acetyl-gamma-glutamylphosphate reductase
LPVLAAKTLTRPQTTAWLSGWQGGGQQNTARENAKESKDKIKPEPGKSHKHVGK